MYDALDREYTMLCDIRDGVNPSGVVQVFCGTTDVWTIIVHMMDAIICSETYGQHLLDRQSLISISIHHVVSKI